MDQKAKTGIDLKTLESLHDQLKVKAHLFKAELKDRWVEVEKDFQTLRSEAEQLRPVAARAAARALTASKPLLSKIELSLNHIRDEFKRHHGLD